LKIQDVKKRKESREKKRQRTSNCRRLDDWETIIEHTHFFHWLLPSIGERLTAETRERKKTRETREKERDPYTQQEDNCMRRK